MTVLPVTVPRTTNVVIVCDRTVDDVRKPTVTVPMLPLAPNPAAMSDEPTVLRMAS